MPAGLIPLIQETASSRTGRPIATRQQSESSSILVSKLSLQSDVVINHVFFMWNLMEAFFRLFDLNCLDENSTETRKFDEKSTIICKFDENLTTKIT